MIKKSVKSSYYRPKPLFDTLEQIEQQIKHYQSANNAIVFKEWLKSLFTKLPKIAIVDYQKTILFLYSYRGSLDTLTPIVEN